MRVIARRKRMATFGKFREDVGSGGRQPQSAVVAAEAGLLVGAAKQTSLSGRVVRHMARHAGILGDRRVAANIGLIQSAVCSRGVNADRPVGKEIGLAVYDAAGIVTRQAELPATVVANQELAHRMITGLEVRVMAARTLDGALNQLNRRIFRARRRRTSPLTLCTPPPARRLRHPPRRRRPIIPRSST